MLRFKILFLAFAAGVLPTLACPSDAEAGPLLDWIRNRCRRPSCAQPMGCAQPAGFATNACGLQPGQCLKTCQQTCSRTVVSYVPYTAYRTEWKRVPVTSYRPVTNSDPCTGCTVTCMRPCTTYTYQCQRIPYTTHRPVYRTETYQVPVTTLTNDCDTGACSTCPTCPTCVAPTAPVPGNFAPTTSTPETYYEYPTAQPPRGAIINPSGTYNTNVVPADQSPTLAPQSSRPYVESLRTEPARTIYTPPAANSQPTNYEARTPARKDWNFTPARLASHSASISRSTSSARSSDGMQAIAPRKSRYSSNSVTPIRTTNQQDDLNGWKLIK